MEPLPHSRACLSTVPPEIKLEICRMARDQDEAFNVPGIAETPFQVKRRQEGIIWSGQSLITLSSVDKEFHDLANSFVFEVSQSFARTDCCGGPRDAEGVYTIQSVNVKQATNPIFIHRFWPQYGKFIKTLILESYDPDDPDYSPALALAVHWPNLTRLVYYKHAEETLYRFNSGHGLSPLMKQRLWYARESLDKIFMRISHLTTITFRLKLWSILYMYF